MQPNMLCAEANSSAGKQVSWVLGNAERTVDDCLTYEPTDLELLVVDRQLCEACEQLKHKSFAVTFEHAVMV